MKRNPFNQRRNCNSHHQHFAAGSVRQRLNSSNTSSTVSTAEPLSDNERGINPIAPNYSLHHIFMTISEVVELGFPEHYIRERLAQGTIPYQMSGKKYYINVPLMLAQFDEETIGNMEPVSAETAKKALNRRIEHTKKDAANASSMENTWNKAALYRAVSTHHSEKE